ncbi:HAMP domain-containing histidine kinase [Nocardia sp. NBC_01503]|uniref:sensor histidine kinase n=1 Tax=Nocardia sp. NBC_01503 TaxID=2975997 RepID=UPI002E7B4020|nr:HAMP domain-containing sensor histidine kinase [Nocardia sp. NBC_01503]WTL29575.1 HAMP domain-containing histidine kinase [Nocardia sp. NBC_01503]
MRGRLLLTFTMLAAICMIGFAIGIGGQLAANRTRGLMIDRIGDASRFAAWSAGDSAGLVHEAQNYYDRSRNGVLVIDADGTVRCDLGVDRNDPRIIDAVDRARRYQPPPLPQTLYPWSRPTMLVAQPVGSPPVAAGVVLIAASTVETTTGIADGWIQLACITASALLVFGGLALVLSGWILRPVSELIRNVEALTATLPVSGRTPRTAPGSDDGPREILELADAVGALTHAVAESAAAERRHVADTAHSMRNPLAALSVRLEALQPAIAGGRAESTFASIVSEVDRLTGLLDDLLAEAVAEAVAEARQSCGTGELVAAAPETCDAVSVAEDRVEAWHAAFARAGMALTVELQVPTARMRAPAQILTQILDVALSNSARYAGAGAHATVVVAQESDSAVISVRDNGIGVPQDELDRLTTRFFRGGNAAAGGSGLGLPIAATLAGKHGGLFFLDTAETGGLVVTVSFPAVLDRAESR